MICLQTSGSLVTPTQRTFTTKDSPLQTGKVYGTFKYGVAGLKKVVVPLITEGASEVEITPDTRWTYTTAVPFQVKDIKGLKIKWEKTGNRVGDEIKINFISVKPLDKEGKEIGTYSLFKRFTNKKPIKNGQSRSMQDGICIPFLVCLHWS